MKGCLVVFAVSVGLFAGGLVLPMWPIDSGVEDFGSESFLNRGDYTGPPLVLGWHVESVKGCPPLPPDEEPGEGSYRAYAGASDAIGACTLFGIPKGEVEVTCGAAGSGSRASEPPFRDVRG